MHWDMPPNRRVEPIALCATSKGLLMEYYKT